MNYRNEVWRSGKNIDARKREEHLDMETVKEGMTKLKGMHLLWGEAVRAF
jgi:hypothetical protein